MSTGPASVKRAWQRPLSPASQANRLSSNPTCAPDNLCESTLFGALTLPGPRTRSKSHLFSTHLFSCASPSYLGQLAKQKMKQSNNPPESLVFLFARASRTQMLQYPSSMRKERVTYTATFQLSLPSAGYI